MTDGYTYGSGIVISGDWLLQNPMFAGYAAVEAYLPRKKIAIAVAATFEPEAFDDQGNYSNAADVLFRRIGARTGPDRPRPCHLRSSGPPKVSLRGAKSAVPLQRPHRARGDAR